MTKMYVIDAMCLETLRAAAQRLRAENRTQNDVVCAAAQAIDGVVREARECMLDAPAVLVYDVETTPPAARDPPTSWEDEQDARDAEMFNESGGVVGMLRGT